MMLMQSPRGAAKRMIRMASGGLVAGVLVASLAACGDQGDLSIENQGDTDVVVDTGDDVTTVDAGGGAVLLGYGCTPGDVTVTFSPDRDVVLAGPVCPDQVIVVANDTARLRPAPPSET